jgi:hypothetical protein
MPSTYTLGKNFELPANGSYNDDWDVPTNQTISAINNSFCGVTQINVTGVAGGVYALSPTQYQPPNIEFTGALSGTIYYTITSGVGGMWSISNNTSGTFNLYFCSAGNSNYLLPQGQRVLVICDGINVQTADTAGDASTLATAEAFANAAANTAYTNAYTNSTAFATSAANTAQSNAETYAASQASAAQTNAEGYALTQATNAQSAAISASEAFTTTSIKANYRAGTFNCINGTVTVTFSTPFPVGTTPVVLTSFNYISYNAGGIPTGTITNAGFNFSNSNAGPVAYYAVVAN